MAHAVMKVAVRSDGVHRKGNIILYHPRFDGVHCGCDGLSALRCDTCFDGGISGLQ